MNIHLVKLGGAFIAGTAATAGLVRLIYWAPIPAYIKFVLAIVVPAPSIAIALTLLYYGPPAGESAGILGGTGAPREWLRMFLYGGLATIGYAAAAALWRMFQHPADRAHHPGNDDE